MNKKNQKGMAAVELAALMPIFILLLFFGIEGSNAVHTHACMSEAGREAARLIVNKGDDSEVNALVSVLTADLSAKDIGTNVIMDKDNKIVTVEVNYEYECLFANVLAFQDEDGNALQFSSKTSMPLP
jgi:Flp pilus assembly protein TadG